MALKPRLFWSKVTRNVLNVPMGGRVGEVFHVIYVVRLVGGSGWSRWFR